MNYLLRPQGNLDLQGGSLLHQKATSIIPKGTNSCWIIDLSYVKDINNFGLTALVAVRRIARQKGCRLYLFNLKGSLRWIFEITGFDREFEILEGTEAVLKSGWQLLLC